MWVDIKHIKSERVFVCIIIISIIIIIVINTTSTATTAKMISWTHGLKDKIYNFRYEFLQTTL